jgi:hypothetical protein
MPGWSERREQSTICRNRLARDDYRIAELSQFEPGNGAKVANRQALNTHGYEFKSSLWPFGCRYHAQSDPFKGE